MNRNREQAVNRNSSYPIVLRDKKDYAKLWKELLRQSHEAWEWEQRDKESPTPPTAPSHPKNGRAA